MIHYNKRLLSIPIAAKNRYTTEECLNWLKSCLNPLGVKDITIWDDLSNKNFNDIKEFDAIYIGGGNTYSLLKDLRETGFIKILKKYIEQDGLVYGGSAGAVILGKDVITSNDKNEVEIKNTEGLNYNENKDSVIKEIRDKYNLKIVALPEGTGLFVDNGTIIIKGVKSAFIFDKEKREIKVNHVLKF